jgi:phosphatidylglycerophosphatase C
MNLALFDFDGTLTVRDMLPDFVRGAVSPLRRYVGGAVIAPWVLGYRHGWVSGVSIRSKLARVAFAGMREANYLEAGEGFARLTLPQVLRSDAMATLRAHRERGDIVVVVSGGFDVYLSHWCREHGVDLICSSLEVVDGRLTGRYAGAQCVNEEKARRVRERYDLSSFDEVHAYGDSREDLAMLTLAEHRWYRGKPMLAIP